MAPKSKKGYAFEFFVKQLLIRNGFIPVISDNELIYDIGIGQMIHGLGQPHNADVLVSPPYQTPFYFPTRLLVECKCYSGELGIGFARNVLGLREDINNFDIVTPDILLKRRNYKRTATAIFNFERYSYQVALASLTGFKKTTQEFALVHRIPLISFSSSLFTSIKDLILSFDMVIKEDQVEDKQINEIIRFFHSSQMIYEPYYNDNLFSYSGLSHWLNMFINEVNHISRNIDIGILDNGNLLFMYRDTKSYSVSNGYNDGCTIHWNSENSYWTLENLGEEFTYHFELPADIMQEWAVSVDKRKSALDIKETYFSSIIIYQTHHKPYPDVKVLRLSKNFMRDAFDNLN